MLAAQSPTHRAAKLALLALVLFSPTHAYAQLGFSKTTPSQRHFYGIEELYRGEYRDAARVFRIEARGSIKIGVTNRWIDAICYHAMWGEVLYHQGHPREALAQFDQACTMFLQYPKWMLKVDFQRQPPRLDTNRIRRPIPWGTSTRQFKLGRFSDQMLVSQGDMYSGNRALKRGGVVNQLQFWKANVIEIIRCTALAIRRRNELLGPLGPQDTISRALVSALSTGAAPPNHWSGAWADLQLGLAQAGVGDFAQAERRLQRAIRVAGEFDHPLTCVALLELGRLAMRAGKTDAANDLFAEASYSAFYYEDTGVIDEAFRFATANRFAGSSLEINPALEAAAGWARHKRYFHLLSRLRFAQAEELMAVGNWPAAAVALKAGQSRLRDARAGLLGGWSQYLEARVLFQQNREAAQDTLYDAIARHHEMSTHTMQIRETNRRFDQQQLRARTAVGVYKSLLGDPNPADWIFQPLQTLTAIKTSHDEAFDRWLIALTSRDNMAEALEVTDLAKRRRFLSTLAWGGRLAALRDAVEAPEQTLSANVRDQRNQLMLKFPEYAAAKQAGSELQAKLQTDWQQGIDDKAERQLTKIWRDWAANLELRESMLAQIGLQRVAVSPQFPPVLATTDLQSKLKPGEALLVFHDTPGNLLGFLITADGATHWNCGPSAAIGPMLNAFLRDLGNYDANHQMTAEELTSDDWKKSGAKLVKALLEGSSIDPASLTELVIVPDGLVWYVPFTALPFEIGGEIVPLISKSRVRVAPTAGIAFGLQTAWRRVQRTGVVGDDLFSDDSDQTEAEALAAFREAVVNPIDLPDPMPVSTPIVASLLEGLVVLDDIELSLASPLDWSPIPGGRAAKRGSLGYWLTLPQFGPQRVILPVTHTLAARGGKGSKRHPATARPGTELFLASCALTSTGAKTILLGNWRVGGASTVEIIREFVQELPHTSAAEAWQRSVQLAAELPIEAALERRVKTSKGDTQLTAAHPFFWGGYLLIDTGSGINDDSIGSLGGR